MPKGIQGFLKGQPKVPGSGRKRGTVNKATEQVREMARRIVDDPQYQETLLSRARFGELSPLMERVLWEYAYGRPPEKIAEESERGGLIYLQQRGRVGIDDPLAGAKALGTSTVAELVAQEAQDNQRALAALAEHSPAEEAAITVDVPEDPDIMTLPDELEEIVQPGDYQ